LPDTGGSAVLYICKPSSDRYNSRRAAVSQFAERGTRSNYLTIPIIPPYLKKQNQIVNDLGLPIKDYYMTRDLCKVLKIKPDNLRSRFRRGHYPEPTRVNGKRVFTLQEINTIIEKTERLFK
jgi:hypothetical protein